ncbi:MAG: 1-deoxy-D-xylulose-5-phosphate synthase [Kiritimatiellia bacterium]
MMTPQEIRTRILETVSRNGGHLASSLGAVEIALALHETFDARKDRIVWDVGHQAYAWKLLTAAGRKPFSTLRQFGGLAPFPNPAESVADAAVAGHAGVSVSVAAGFAAARDRKGTDEQVVAVVGDGALVNGTNLEALNNLAVATEKLIVVLNDNEMSISRPAGSLAKLLGRLITNVRYNRVKTAAENAGHRLRLTFLRGVYHRLESRIKSWFLGNAFFEQFGLRYIGPVDGHDLAALRSAFTVAKEDKRSVLVHVVTKKGKGFGPAERDPTAWHGVGPFPYGEGEGAREARAECRKALSWSDAFGRALCEIAREDARVVALTAGMKDGTGLAEFAREFPKRFYDVGIAEGHMVSFAAGLAAGGCRPVVAVYSTFLQRAVDQIMHDVCIASLPVVFCVDRAGAVGADGVTHQGIYDIALLRTFPNLTICQPKDAADLKALLAEALARGGPTVIRYPRGTVPDAAVGAAPAHRPADGADRPPPLRHAFALWATGDQLDKAAAVAARLPGTEVTFARMIKPFDRSLLARQRAEGRRIVALENGAVAGGFGESIGADLRFGWPDVFIPHGSVAELERRYGFDVEAIVAAIRQFDASTS